MRKIMLIVVASCGGNPGHVDIGDSVLELHGSPARAGAYVAPTLTHAAAASLHLDGSFELDGEDFPVGHSSEPVA